MSFFHYLDLKTYYGRVDPCAASVTGDNSLTPIEIATSSVACGYQDRCNDESGEMVAILAEFTEVPDDVKLEGLSKLMYFNEKEETQEKFRKLLGWLPVDLVRGEFLL